MEILWRDGLVPEWINLSVISEQSTYTLIEVLACGRFTDNEKLLYHINEGYPPFHVLGPTLPPLHENGVRFSIHHRTECWNIDELNYAEHQKEHLWSLSFEGQEFNNEILLALPIFPNLEILELQNVPVDGETFPFLIKFPKLRCLRMTLPKISVLDLRQFPLCCILEELTLNNIPSEILGFDQLPQRIPKTSDINLHSEHNWPVSEFPEIKSLQNLNIRFMAATYGLTIHLLKNLTQLSLNGDAFNDNIVTDILDKAPEKLESLSLRNTKIGDRSAKQLKKFHKLKYLDLVDTLVTEEMLKQLRTERPDRKIFPRQI